MLNIKKGKYLGNYKILTLIFANLLVISFVLPFLSDEFTEELLTGLARYDARHNAYALRRQAKIKMAEALKFSNQLILYDVNSPELFETFRGLKAKISSADALIYRAKKVCEDEISSVYSTKIWSNNQDSASIEEEKRQQINDCGNSDRFGSPLSYSKMGELMGELDNYLTKGTCIKRYGFLGLKKKILYVLSQKFKRISLSL